MDKLVDNAKKQLNMLKSRRIAEEQSDKKKEGLKKV